jgi:hypothetical protein
MTNIDLNDPREATRGNARTTFEDRALLAFYAVVVGVAMSGWLWFLAWLSWQVAVSIVTAIG